MALSRAAALRIAAHIAVWIPFIYGATISLQSGWRPISDDAGIALRTWDVLTRYGPLVGQPSRLARGVYDLGPIQYWLLAVPTHLDPAHGTLWGATLWCMVASSLAIEAAWAVSRGTGAVLAAVAVIAAVLWIPVMASDPPWNPWFGLMFFLAAFAAGWAVMCGRRGWAPVLMITASIAAQAHLMFAIASAVLVVVAFAVGLADTIRARASYRWALAGLAAAIACWAAPVVQNFTTKPGNLAAIFDNQSTGGRQGGLTFGLKAVAASVRVPPVWFTRLNSLPGLYPVAQRSVALGVAVLVVLAALGVVAAWKFRSRRTVMLVAVSLVACVTAVVTFSDVPVSNIMMRASADNSLNYLMAPMIAVGVLAWLAVGTFLVLAGRWAIGRVRAGTAAREDGGSGATPAAGVTAARWAIPAGAAATVALIGLTWWASDGVNAESSSVAGPARTVSVAAREIEAKLHYGQRISLTVVSADRHSRRRLTFGLVYALHSAGYIPEVTKNYAWQLGSVYERQGNPVRRRVTVSVGSSSISVSVKK
jgi:hypothetical protein